jgi:predicted regulator of Ras-like GTPase activity (Roadblock/LC7/MglB family)
MRDLDWLLEGLASTASGMRSAVILSPDGLPLGRSPGLSEADADHLSALAAGAHSLARGTGRKFGYGEVVQTVVEMDMALLFVTPVCQGTCIALLADADGAGQIAL